MPTKSTRRFAVESLEAKRLLSGNTPCADINDDGIVDFGDFLILSGNFSESGTYEEGDISGDGVVGFPDVLWLGAQFGSSCPPAFRDIIAVATQYLSSTDAQERNELATKLAEQNTDIDEIVAKLRSDADQNLETRTGELLEEPFTKPELDETYDADRIFYYVPENYDASKPTGLLVFMHGGGANTPITYARVSTSLPSDYSFSYGLRPRIDASQFIIAAPSAPMHPTSSARWNLPEADDYIDAVIQEANYRFNIDADKVFLGGSSMGGFGAYHLCQRLADRIAGCIASAGSWTTANWRSMIGTPMFIIHATNDAVPPGPDGSGGRPRYTDWFYAERAQQLLEEAGVSHVLAAHDGGHNLRNSGKVDEMVDWMDEQRRDPYFPEVVVLSKRSWRTNNRTSETLDNRWVSILETTPGTLAYDVVKLTGPRPRWGESLESFNQQSFTTAKTNVSASAVEAKNLGDNVFEVATENVSTFSLWLHPEMADFSQPITVITNGKHEQYKIQPSLLDALRSYERRNDWGLVYHHELQISVVESD